VHARIRQQVGQHLLEPALVSVDDHRVRRDVQTPALFGSGGLRVGQAFDTQHGQIN
jgi:hypothetical protein